VRAASTRDYDPVMGLMSVRTELVREQLVGRIIDAAVERHPDAVPTEIREAIADGVGPDQVSIHLAELGYLCREVELEMFTPAREPADWLGEELADRAHRSGGGRLEAAVELARELARAEPADRPDPEPETASWRIPGPGGHVRHYVAAAAIERELANHQPPAARPDPDRAAELKRCWHFGFFLRACREVQVSTP
jgi:hypothetical protein